MLLLYRYEKMVIFFYPFLARSNCNMLCLLSVDDVCVLFIVYVRICVAAVNLTLQDSRLLFTRMSAQWEIAKKCKHIWTKWFFSNLCCSIFDSFKLHGITFFQNRVEDFQRKMKNLLQKNIFLFLFSNVKGFMSWNLLLGLWWRQYVNCLGFCLPVIPVPCYYGRLFLFSIFQCLAVCCAIYGKKYQNLYVFLI